MSLAICSEKNKKKHALSCKQEKAPTLPLEQVEIKCTATCFTKSLIIVIEKEAVIVFLPTLFDVITQILLCVH